MKKSIKTIGIIATMGIIALGSYLLGTTQTETVTAGQMIPEIRQTVSMYDRYIVMDATVFQDNYIDMREVVDFEVSNDGLQLYFEDGTGYWLER